MTEYGLGTLAFGGLIINAIGAWCYMAGGRSGTWRRRFIGSLIIATALWVEALLLGVFSFWLLLAYPLYIGTFVLGYGAEVPWIKVLKRSIIVAASLTIGVMFCLLFGGTCWLVLPLNAVIAAGSIWLGVKNPVDAPVEEFFVCLFLTEVGLLYPFAAKLSLGQG